MSVSLFLLLETARPHHDRDGLFMVTIGGDGGCLIICTELLDRSVGNTGLRAGRKAAFKKEKKEGRVSGSSVVFLFGCVTIDAPEMMAKSASVVAQIAWFI